MSEEQQQPEGEPQPRDETGKFKSKPAPIIPEKPKVPDFLGSAIDSTIALLKERGLLYSKDDFEGMNDDQIFQFLDNQRKKLSTKKEPQKPKASNEPIIPVPVGDKPRFWTDKYLKIDPNRREIEFIAPVSEILKNKNKQKKQTNIRWT